MAFWVDCWCWNIHLSAHWIWGYFYMQSHRIQIRVGMSTCSTLNLTHATCCLPSLSHSNNAVTIETALNLKQNVFLSLFFLEAKQEFFNWKWIDFVSLSCLFPPWTCLLTLAENMWKETHTNSVEIFWHVTLWHETKSNYWESLKVFIQFV